MASKHGNCHPWYDGFKVKERPKLKRLAIGAGTILLVGVVSYYLFIIVFYFSPYFRCSPYYTQVYYYDLRIPDQREFAGYFKENGWQVLLGVKPKDVWAKKEFTVVSETLQASVKMIPLRRDLGKGNISIFIDGGSESAQRQLFEEVVQDINQQFGLNLDTGEFIYRRTCD